MIDLQVRAAGRSAAAGASPSGPTSATSDQAQALPRAPVFDWPARGMPGPAGLPSVGDLPAKLFVTSGRAALAAALGQIDTTPDDGVLVPTYHCPTMVAPVLVRGLQPVLYPIGPDGLPRLSDLADADLSRVRFMFAAHFFGLTRSLHAVRAWCDARGIVLVEDCAHSFFGMAGERPVGTWGHLATASLSKFFPMREGGLLARAEGRLRPVALQAPGLKRHAQSMADVFEFASQHDRPAGLAPMLKLLFAAKRRWRQSPWQGAPNDDNSGPADAAQVMQACDMARVGEAPAMAVDWILRRQALASIVRQRQANFDSLQRGLAGLDGATPLFQDRPQASAPYVMPLWVPDAALADRLYAALRQRGLPVFRWDRLWPGLQPPAEDSGCIWSRRVLQLLCHQSLRQVDVNRIVDTTRHCLKLV
jgi:perosamine synthetase